jgi:polyisoprenoid-binding protein YceI
MNRILFLALLFVVGSSVTAQKYFSKNAIIKFHSESPIEKIEAVNSTATTVIDVATGKIEFAALNNAFIFEKALMQEHFNENYMESSKYPKTIFKGMIQDIGKVKFNTPGTYRINVTGDLNMHGVVKTINVLADMTVDANGLHGYAKFTVKCSDYNIKIPSLVKDNISNDIDITVKVDYNLLSQ